MRKFFWLLPLTIILCGCPFESNVPLDTRPADAVDTTLTGYWYGIVKDGSDFFGIEALDISPQSDSVYSITRYGKAIKGDMVLPDTAHFTGYTSQVNGHSFMNVVADVLISETDRKGKVQVRTQRVFYLAAFSRSNDTLLVKTVTEDFSKRKNYKSPDDLQQTIAGFLKEGKNIFDEQYSLSYKKMNSMKTPR
jgi:hypothetical protein